MEYTVTLSNCNQRFKMQETESILEAAIRAGVSINYGCSGGSCGLCRARLLKGSVREIRPHVFVLPESEKLQGGILTCVHTACEDLELDAIVASSVHDISTQDICVKVRKVESVAPEIYKVTVQTPRTQRLRFMAGQYVELTKDQDTIGHLAIASCPCEDRLIEFHVRAVEDDAFANYIATEAKSGDMLQLQGPLGEFVYDDNANRPVILFAFDTGFAAIKSLLEHITAQEQELPIHLIWMSCGQHGLYLNNLCRSWNDAFDNFTYTGIVLEESLQQLAANPEVSRATVSSRMQDVMRAHEDLSGYDVYISAPETATALFKQICMDKNVLARRFFAEPVRGNEDMTCLLTLKKITKRLTNE